MSSAIPAGSYHIKKGSFYLAVGPNKTLITQGEAYTWEVAIVDGHHNSIQDQQGKGYLRDDTSKNYLSIDQDKHTKWAGAWLAKYDTYLLPSIEEMCALC